MKKIASLIIIAFALASCSISKEARGYNKAIDGNWQLQTVSTEGIMGKINFQLFNEADYDCFIGTTWNFNNSNSLGHYTITKTEKGCTPVKRNIRWSIYEPKNEAKQFQFKKLDDKYKVMDNGDGFRFTMVQLDKNTMQLKSKITFENKPAWIIYNFVKS